MKYILHCVEDFCPLTPSQLFIVNDGKVDARISNADRDCLNSFL